MRQLESATLALKLGPDSWRAVGGLLPPGWWAAAPGDRHRRWCQRAASGGCRAARHWLAAQSTGQWSSKGAPDAPLSGTTGRRSMMRAAQGSRPRLSKPPAGLTWRLLWVLRLLRHACRTGACCLQLGAALLLGVALHDWASVSAKCLVLLMGSLVLLRHSGEAGPDAAARLAPALFGGVGAGTGGGGDDLGDPGWREAASTAGTDRLGLRGSHRGGGSSSATSSCQCMVTAAPASAGSTARFPLLAAASLLCPQGE